MRTPAPELLLGHPGVVQSAIAALPFKASYRVALLSFDPSDVDVALFNDGDKIARQSVSGAIDLFLELAFAGLPRACRPPVFAGTHTHTGRLEINIVMPRFVRAETGKLRSYNPGTVALICEGHECVGKSLGLCVREQFADELDLPSNARLLVVDVTSFDCSDGFDAAQRRFGGSQGTKALVVSEEPFGGRMIAFDQVVAPLSVDVPDAVKMRVI